MSEILHLTKKEIKFINDKCNNARGYCKRCVIGKRMGWCPKINLDFCGNNIVKHNMIEFRNKIKIP